MARVFSDLEREGYVESRRGSGVYVVEPPVEAEDLRRQEVLEGYGSRGGAGCTCR